jgi:protein-S-isoprenylcysteine O-methyltransferase Ste14
MSIRINFKVFEDVDNNCYICSVPDSLLSVESLQNLYIFRYYTAFFLGYPMDAAHAAVSYLPSGIVRQRVKITVGVTTLFILAKILLGHKPLNPLELQNPWVSAGLAMIVVGLLFRSWAAGLLKKTEVLAMTGPYRLVRHPLYAGSILMIMGFTALLGHPVDFCVTGLLSLVCFGLAIHSEEAFLALKFGNAWNQYAVHTGAIFPRSLAISFQDSWSIGQWMRNREYNAWLGTWLGFWGLYLWRIW